MKVSRCVRSGILWCWLLMNYSLISLCLRIPVAWQRPHWLVVRSPSIVPTIKWKCRNYSVFIAGDRICKRRPIFTPTSALAAYRHRHCCYLVRPRKRCLNRTTGMPVFPSASSLLDGTRTESQNKIPIRLPRPKRLYR